MQCFSGLCIWKPKLHCHQCTSNQRYKWFYQNKIAWLKLTNRCLRLTDNYVTPTFYNPINFQIKSIPTLSFSFHMSHYGCKVVQKMTLKRPGLLIVIKIYFYPSHIRSLIFSPSQMRSSLCRFTLCLSIRAIDWQFFSKDQLRPQHDERGGTAQSSVQKPLKSLKHLQRSISR